MGAQRFSAADEALLREALKQERPDLLPLVDEIASGRSLSVDEANEIRQAVGLELASTGIEEDSSGLNERGLALDDLIDLVARASVFQPPE